MYKSHAMYKSDDVKVVLCFRGLVGVTHFRLNRNSTEIAIHRPVTLEFSVFDPLLRRDVDERVHRL